MSSRMHTHISCTITVSPFTPFNYLSFTSANMSALHSIPHFSHSTVVRSLSHIQHPVQLHYYRPSRRASRHPASSFHIRNDYTHSAQAEYGDCQLTIDLASPGTADQSDERNIPPVVRYVAQHAPCSTTTVVPPIHLPSMTPSAWRPL